MVRQRSRSLVLLAVTVAVGSGSLFIPQPASAVKQMFRMERRFFGAPFPPIRYDTPQKNYVYGGAGRYEEYVIPYTPNNPYPQYGLGEANCLNPRPNTPATCAYNRGGPPALATVAGSCAVLSPLGKGCAQFTPNANKVGSPFTLPRSFQYFQGTNTNTAYTAFPGYTTVSAFTSYNGLGQFRPNNVGGTLTYPAGSPTRVRVVFPTTAGNPSPNLGSGLPVASTNTFTGRYDQGRAGSLNVKPGPNRFGGTMRILFGSGSLFYQYIFVDSPVLFKAYGTFLCRYGTGVNKTLAAKAASPPGAGGQGYGGSCTGGSVTETTIGQLDSTGMVTRFVLTPAGSKKATTPNNGNYVTAKNYYLHLIHPWTTGGASAYDYASFSAPQIRPYYKGYDKSLGGANLTVTHTYTAAFYKGKNYTKGAKVYYYYYTHKQYLNDVRRVVSLVRPRLIHTYERPVPPDPILIPFQAARLWTMRIFFLPEPGVMLMLGAGVAALAGLALLRRR